MRNLFAIMTLLLGCLTFAQNDNSNFTNNNNNNSIALAATGQNNIQQHGAAYFVNPARRTVGSKHLFDEWNNNAIIYTTDNQKFLLKNINLNLQRNAFESKVAQDSIFSFNFNNIDKFVINNKIYKNYYWDDDNKVYQVIYESEEFQILKGFNLTLVEGSANPMLGRKNDRYVKKSHYYLRKEGEITSFKLKKKKILKLVKGDEAKAKMIEEYAKNNSLSFKKENDIPKILEFSAKN